MYTGYLFIVAFAILVTTAVTDDSISTKLDDDKISMQTDDLCKKAGFVKNPHAATKAASTGNGNSSAGSEPQGMSATAITLTILGCTVAVLGAGLFALYWHGKAKPE